MTSKTYVIWVNPLMSELDEIALTRSVEEVWGLSE
jgi:hypothetical protein